MPARNCEELLNAFNAFIGDDPTEDALSFMTDIRDTFANPSNEDWKKKYEQNDKEWRKKYKDAFFNTPVSSENDGEDKGKPTYDPSKITIDNLFVDKKGA